MASKAFGGSVARAAHFVRPGSGYKGELYDLRTDVEAGFSYLEGSTPLTATTLYLDPLNGLDTNDGVSSGGAIKTLVELALRLRYVQANTEYVVNVLNAVPVTDVLRLRCQVVGSNPLVSNVVQNGVTIRFVGQQTTVRSGTFTAGTQGTDPTRAVATAQAEAVDTGVADWTADVGRLLVDTTGGQTAWIASAKGGGNTARVGDWCGGTTFVYTASIPIATDAYSVRTLTTWNAPVVFETQWDGWWNSTGNPQVVFQDIHFANAGKARQWTGVATVLFRRCRFSNEADSPVTSNFALPCGSSSNTPAGRYVFLHCMFDNVGTALSGVTVTGTAGLSVTFNPGCVSRKMRFFQGPSTVAISGMLIQGGWWQSGTSTGEQMAGALLLGSTAAGFWVGIYTDYDLPAASGISAHILAGRSSCVFILGSLYGKGDGVTAVHGLYVARARAFIFAGLWERGHGSETPTTCWNLTESGAGVQLSVDALATLVPNPDFNAGGSGLLPARTSYTTFTLWRTTFNRNAINMLNGAGIFNN